MGLFLAKYLTMSQETPIKGQGAQRNVYNRFAKYSIDLGDEEDFEIQKKTKFIEVFPKSIVNEVKSPDLGMDYSLNPYQGCEHGCSYCFARPTHEYWGYNAGVDFERIIMYKKNAPELLEKFFKKRGYVPKPITLSGNTDCYQPIEQKLQITRQLLQLFLDYRHPVGIITKNALLLRDLDILESLAQQNLIKVNLSIPTINEDLRRKMEPRTSTIKNKLKAVEVLSQHGIPVNVMIAPIIPGLNSDEVLGIVKAAADCGAESVSHSIVRINDSVEPVFVDWLEKSFPDRKEKVLNLIKSMRGGKLGEKQFFERYKGEGNIAELIHNTFDLGKKKFFKDKVKSVLDTSNFTGSRDQQLRLF